MTAEWLGPTATPTLTAMAQAAMQAGEFLMQASSQRPNLSVTEKTAGDFVSDADVRCEALIKSILTRHCPDYGWVGEETGGRLPTGGEPCWVVDPLDGTTNFLKGLPHWATSIALCNGEDVECAVIFDPTKNELFSAQRGQGAYLNGTRLQVSSDVSMQSAVFATGVPNGARVSHLRHCLRDLDALMPRTGGVRRWGAAALDLAYVAAGRVDGYWERNLGPWDIAAGCLLVEEAGGTVAPLWAGQNVLSSGSFVASNAQLGPELIDLLDRTP